MVGGLYPSTIEGFALFLVVLAAALGLPYGCAWLVKASAQSGLMGMVFPSLGLAGYALWPVLVVGFLVFAYRHSGPPD